MSTLDIIIIVLIVLWLGGFVGKIGGKFIHLLLIIAAVILLVRLLS